jgi:hypothetical protein
MRLFYFELYQEALSASTLVGLVQSSEKEGYWHHFSGRRVDFER